MFVYLSKKIAIPNQNKVRCLSWSSEHGYIACGGDYGLLKVLKLDVFESKVISGLSTPRNLSMNQTLEGHHNSVQDVLWNDKYQKLTSSDASGLIIVWMMYRGSWYEEMINNRNKSVVCGMAWTADGMKICIAYEDGAIIVGSVDGNRLWGKDIKSIKLSCVEWSPDGKILLFGSVEHQVHAYDQFGNFISKVPLPAIEGVYGRSYHSTTANTANVVDVKWFKSEIHSAGLVIAFSNGLLQFMRNECDESPIIIDCAMNVACIRWNNSGTILAVTGRNNNEPENKRNFVKFYDPTGELLQTLRVPGKEISTCSWEKDSLRLAVAVDCYIFFANIRPNYKWCYFSSTVVFAVPVSYVESDTNQGSVVFCEINSNQKHVKNVKYLQAMTAFGSYCVFSTKTQEIDSTKSTVNSQSSTLTVYNTIGSPVDCVDIDVPVCHLAMNSNRVFAASKDCFYVWKFKVPVIIEEPKVSETAQSRAKSAAHRLKYGIDEQDLFYDEIARLSSVFVSKTDQINCITVSEKILIVAQDIGCFQVYNLPQASLAYKFSVNCKPVRIEINCDSSKLAIADNEGILVIYDLDENQNLNNAGKLMHFERKDVWDFKWAIDNSDLFAVTEKAKLHTFSALEPEDAVQSYGYVCCIEDLIVKTVLIDALIIDFNCSEDEINIEKYIVNIETKRLKEMKEIIEKSGLSEATKFVEQNEHIKLWRLLANYALNELDLTAAELAFVHCKDYKGIQFTKRVAKMQKDELKKAEVFAYFGQFDEAETTYLNADRKDLAISLRKLIGDSSKVVQLIKSDFSSVNDKILKDALSALGDDYVDRHQWSEAVTYYEQCAAWERLFECYSILEDYDGLIRVLKNIEADHVLLPEIGRIFETTGMCEEAVEAYLKCHKTDFAINCCVNLNEWKTAIKLAEEYDVPDIDPILHQYASHLLAKEKYFDIVELYRKANRVNDAASVLLKIAEEAKKKNSVSPILLKKIYVLIGFLYEERSTITKDNQRVNVLSSLLKDDQSVNTAATVFRANDQPWKGAEAYHYYILAQRQLHEGYVDAAMKTSLHLIDYDDFIDAEDIFSLIALASCVNHNFKLCSKAFIKLESLDTISEQRRKEYENLSVSIFTKHPPREARNIAKSDCRYCETMIPDWCVVCPNCNIKFPLCVASGRPIMDSNQQWTCKKCNHHAYRSELVTYSNCPLCHHPFTTL
ncbi:WD repeat-containing protein 35-like isoform X1 [Leptotrombidium deliense]|uniref:WD repeat-containing protein 35-like isoform X1 n=1 Tax=Leptotrombidium deliense TaxID=299467 RepID=A0A443SQT5_9ACAR|nr:WD repeat-containing protein 35-like isoform X1 [Leptotrombidium deliense]